MRKVIEEDFRLPEFIGANADDYEFRGDGKIVRKDRWEQGMNRIRFAIGMHTREFEIEDVINAVEVLLSQYPDRDRAYDEDI